MYDIDLFRAILFQMQTICRSNVNFCSIGKISVYKHCFSSEAMIFAVMNAPIPVRRSKQLSCEATDVGSWSFVGYNVPNHRNKRPFALTTNEALVVM